MKWHSAREADCRQRSGFLLFPRTDEITSTTRWLEMAMWEEYYFICYGGLGRWIVDRWLK